MKLAIARESLERERRVACSPDGVKRLRDLGFAVLVESGAGQHAGFPDSVLVEAGAEIGQGVTADADVVLCVRPPVGDTIDRIKPGALLVGLLSPYGDRDRIEDYARQGITAFALEFMPRITRAQGMDALSSQANLGGYAAVIEAAAAFGRAFPMMVTAAGTIAPARVLVLGAGVAGLQAIATARRLGALVSAMDVRPVAREQVESLGATFVEVDSDERATAETAGGYAREMSAAYQQRQQAKLHEILRRTDVCVTTALIPGRPAPRLIAEEMVADMRPGSVIVDMAAEQGGNCAVSEAGKTVIVNGVTVIGDPDLPSRIATDASALYARNLVNFVTLFVDKDTRTLKPNWEDEIVKATCLTRDGRVVHPALLPQEAA